MSILICSLRSRSLRANLWLKLHLAAGSVDKTHPGRESHFTKPCLSSSSPTGNYWGSEISRDRMRYWELRSYPHTRLVWSSLNIKTTSPPPDLRLGFFLMILLKSGFYFRKNLTETRFTGHYEFVSEGNIFGSNVNFFTISDNSR